MHMNLFEYWKTSPEGLSSKEIEERRKELGANIFEEEKKETVFMQFIKEIKNPLNVILLIAAVGSFFLTESGSSYMDTIVIVFAVLLNIFISIFQSRKTNDTFNKLKNLKKYTILVKRDGKKQIIPVEELVVGDIVMLESGDRVPADMVLFWSRKLKVDESSFTGESAVVLKNSLKKNKKKTKKIEDENKIFLGTIISSGEGEAIVTAVGEDTEFGRILLTLQDIEKRKSPMEKKMQKITFLVSIIAIIGAFIVVIAGLISGKTASEIILLGVAVAVAAVPEGIGASISAALSVGSYRILKKGGLVKDLVSAETLASVDTVLTDKTGTLTRGSMTFGKIYSNRLTKKDVKIFATLATSVFWDYRNKKFAGDEMDVAIAESLKKDNLDFNQIQATSKVIDTLPFSSKNKFFASLRESSDGLNTQRIIYVKGAPEKIIESCDKIQTRMGVQDFEVLTKYRFFDIFKKEQSSDSRFLAFAYKKTNMNSLPEEPQNILNDLIFVSLISFSDPIKKNAKRVIDEIKQMGTDVIMVTGDSKEIAYDIAIKTGIITKDYNNVTVIDGDKMKKMTEKELYLATKKTKVFARVSPSEKLKLANAMISGGRTIAMTGDGVNDVLALSKADIGISFKGASEAAQETASLVLMKNDFKIITEAIKEGRNIIENIKKTVIYLLSSSFTEIIVISGALIIGGPLPFLTVHILWANIIEEGLMNFAFVFGKNDYISNNEKFNSKILTKEIKEMIFTFGIYDAITTLGLYYFLTTLSLTDSKLQSLMFLGLALDFFFIAYALHNLRKPIWKSDLFSNRYLNIATLIGLTILGISIFTEWGRGILHLEKFSFLEIFLLMLFALMDLVLIEFLKKRIFEKHNKDKIFISERKKNIQNINSNGDSKIIKKNNYIQNNIKKNKNIVYKKIEKVKKEITTISDNDNIKKYKRLETDMVKKKQERQNINNKIDNSVDDVKVID